MNDDVFDKLLRSALIEAAKEDHTDILSHPETAFPSFSKEYLSKRKKLRNNPFRKTTPMFILKRVVAAVLAITLTAGSLMLIPNVRAAVVNIFFAEYEDHTTVNFNNENHINIGRWYPDYIPDGFVETFYDDTYDNVAIIFSNDTSEIIFQYLPATQGGSITIDSEHSTPYKKYINGNEATVYIANTAEYSNYVIWTEENEETVFVLSSEIDFKELIKIAESVAQTKTE